MEHKKPTSAFKAAVQRRIMEGLPLDQQIESVVDVMNGGDALANRFIADLFCVLTHARSLRDDPLTQKEINEGLRDLCDEISALYNRIEGEE